MNLQELTYNELWGAAEHFEMQLGELTTQYTAEVNHFGDAWPGAQLQLQDLRNQIAAIRGEISRREDHATSYDDIDDIPY